MPRVTSVVALVLASGLVGCGGAPRAPLCLALSRAEFERSPEGRQVPGAASALFLAPEAGACRHGVLRDADSNVFHKLLEYCPAPGDCGLVSAGGTAAVLKLWSPGATARVLWRTDFGGRFSRLRDVEVADVLGDGVPTLVAGTHDQGVVALVRPGAGGLAVTEIDRQPDTFVHEIEVGDLDGDSVLEVYATPSQPNVLDGSVQRGSVVGYVPARRRGRSLVAALGDRHAKEILVADLDRDGRDELYVAVEAVSGGDVEIRRYLAGTPPDAGQVVATLPDRLCRCLSAGDVDADGRPDMVAALHKGGLWLLRPTRSGAWETRLVAADSSGFEHAALLGDIDGDGRAELYVASDDQREVRRYLWGAGGPEAEVLYRHPERSSGFTWSISIIRTALVPAAVWDD